MEEIREVLSFKLSAKGLMPVEIPRLIKDVFNLTGEDRPVAMASVSQRLETLGWDRQIVDRHTLDLILFVLENEPEGGGKAG
jgi:hypothetical protein